MSREEKLREIVEQEQALMRDIYGFDNGVIAERERIIKLLENQHNFDQIFLDAVDQVIALIKGED